MTLRRQHILRIDILIPPHEPLAGLVVIDLWKRLTGAQGFMNASGEGHARPHLSFVAAGRRSGVGLQQSFSNRWSRVLVTSGDRGERIDRDAGEAVAVVPRCGVRRDNVHRGPVAAGGQGLNRPDALRGLGTAGRCGAVRRRLSRRSSASS